MKRPYVFDVADEAHQNRERQKARELRQSQWWRQEIGSGICYHCEQKFAKDELTMDHVVPISRGGKSTKKNVVVSCKACNSHKKNFMAVEMTFQDLEGED